MVGRYFTWGKTAVFWRSVPVVRPRKVARSGIDGYVQPLWSHNGGQSSNICTGCTVLE